MKTTITTGTWTKSEMVFPLMGQPSAKFKCSVHAYGANGNPNNNSHIATAIGSTEAEAMGNAQLIEAAPAMLDALRVALSLLVPTNDYSQKAADKMAAAIAMAMGSPAKSEPLTMELYQSPKKEQNNENHGEFGSECICCGKPMAAGLVDWVHMNEAWLAVKPDAVTEENCEALTGFQSQGCFPIGSECAKKMKGFTFKSELTNSHPNFKNK